MQEIETVWDDHLFHPVNEYKRSRDCSRLSVDCKRIAHIDFTMLITLTVIVLLDYRNASRNLYLLLQVHLSRCRHNVKLPLYNIHMCVKYHEQILSHTHTPGLWTLSKLNLPHVSSCADGLIVQDLRSWRKERNKRLITLHITATHTPKTSGSKHSHTSVKNILLTRCFMFDLSTDFQ